MNQKIKRMIKEAARQAEDLAEHLAKSGGIDPAAPHFCAVVARVALLQTARGCFPLSPEARADAENLMHF
jgi:glutamate/tyrosine decarboxylase-like PLP-dependent enzyme